MSAMPGIWAVVPVKAFGLAKQRLGHTYPPGLRRELAQAMLEDVLDTLKRVAGIAGLAVVTLDLEAGKLARKYGAEVLDEEADGGLNEAVMGAARRLAREGCDGMLVVAGDVPGITVAEVEALLASHRRSRGLSIVPARDRKGTNAYIATPADAIAPAFGEGSFARHLLAGRAARLEPAVLPLPGIGFDLDHPEDVALFAATPSPTRTWRCLLSRGLATPRQSEPAL